MVRRVGAGDAPTTRTQLPRLQEHRRRRGPAEIVPDPAGNRAQRRLAAKLGITKLGITAPAGDTEDPA